MRYIVDSGSQHNVDNVIRTIVSFDGPVTLLTVIVALLTMSLVLELDVSIILQGSSGSYDVVVEVFKATKITSISVALSALITLLTVIVSLLTMSLVEIDGDNLSSIRGQVTLLIVIISLLTML